MVTKKELDATPLVQHLIDKSRVGKLKWEPTADRRAFVTSVGGQVTLKVRLESVTDFGTFGQPEAVEVPRLDMLDDKGKVLWDIAGRDADAKLLSELYEVARRFGNQLDERLASTMAALDKL